MTPERGALEYTEGIHVGYRAWLREGRKPAYAFGFGLGYTTWELSGLEADATISRDGSLETAAHIRNTGGRAGKAVVQWYLERVTPSLVDRPERWLAGFEVVTVEQRRDIGSADPAVLASIRALGRRMAVGARRLPHMRGLRGRPATCLRDRFSRLTDMTSDEVERLFTDFPAEFLWGAATAAHQVEGNNVNSDWWAFEHDPASAARESSGDGIDHLHRFAEDIELLASLGHNAHRFSVEWARIEPAEGEFSRAALDHYGRVLRCSAHPSNDRRSSPSITSRSRDGSPNKGVGWRRTRLLSSIGTAVSCVEFLGDQMPFVCTINEPQMVALHGYLEGYHPPGRTSPVLWKRVGRVLLGAHRVAVRAVHELCSAKVGLVLQMPLLVPARDDAVTRAACAEFEAEIIDLYLDGLVGADRGDWLGRSVLPKQWVDPASPTFFAAPPPGTQLTQMGWAVHPDGLRHMLVLSRGANWSAVVRHGERHRDRRRPGAHRLSEGRTFARSHRHGGKVPTSAGTFIGRHSTTLNGPRATVPSSALSLSIAPTDSLERRNLAPAPSREWPGQATSTPSRALVARRTTAGAAG